MGNRLYTVYDTAALAEMAVAEINEEINDSSLCEYRDFNSDWHKLLTFSDEKGNTDDVMFFVQKETDGLTPEECYYTIRTTNEDLGGKAGPDIENIYSINSLDTAALVNNIRAVQIDILRNCRDQLEGEAVIQDRNNGHGVMYVLPTTDKVAEALIENVKTADKNDYPKRYTLMTYFDGEENHNIEVYAEAENADKAPFSLSVYVAYPDFSCEETKYTIVFNNLDLFKSVLNNAQYDAISYVSERNEIMKENTEKSVGIEVSNSEWNVFLDDRLIKSLDGWYLGNCLETHTINEVVDFSIAQWKSEEIDTYLNFPLTDDEVKRLKADMVKEVEQFYGTDKSRLGNTNKRKVVERE